MIPLDQITDYVSETNKSGVNYVIICPSKGTVWKDILPIIDACRKSTMQAVFLNTNRSL
jgi:hypothetical protein